VIIFGGRFCRRLLTAAGTAALVFFVRGDGEGLEIPRYARLAVKAVILTAL
jgi:hypothetical protein